MQVLNNIALTLFQFQNAIKSVDNRFHVAYTQDISYDSGVIRLRSNNIIKSLNEQHFPAFIYNRKVLKPVPTRRAGFQKPKLTVSGVKNLRSLFGKIEVSFMIIDSSIETIEEQEIFYYTESGIMSKTEFSVDLTSVNLGVFNYQIVWGYDLESLEIVDDERVYKALTGRLDIIGQFFVLEGDGKLIEKINHTIFDASSGVYLPTDPILKKDIIV